jgi:murein DD-endopeptidase MepM/ murein hydrolase activator NlpD
VVATTARGLRTSAVLTLLLALVSAGLVLVGAKPAEAAVGNMLPPFAIGTTWNICQGYNYGTHTATDNSLYGIDLTGSGCNSDAAGRHVLAPISGTLAYAYQAAYGNVCVNIAGNRSYTLTHINLANGFTGSSGSAVTAGQWVGTVAAAGTDGNNGLAHLHFEIWAAPIRQL